MEFIKAMIIRSANKGGMLTAYSKYIFHLFSFSTGGSFGFFEGHRRAWFQAENTRQQASIYFY